MKIMKWILIALAILLVIGGLALWMIKHNAKNMILDGPDMVYDFAAYELSGEWVEVGSDDPAILIFTKDSLRYENFYGMDGTATFTYQNRVISGVNCTYIEVKPNDNNPYLAELIYTRDERGIPFGVLSLIMFEYDGRGMVVTDEFVMRENLRYVDDDYQSELRHALNDADPIPTSMYVEE
ncbi:MAG: hypothetical protein IJJ14_04720 [Coriobacteriales bacterium]|nr:hypothetical protein [Coriobacteriales bacterium]